MDYLLSFGLSIKGGHTSRSNSRRNFPPLPSFILGMMEERSFWEDVTYSNSSRFKALTRFTDSRRPNLVRIVFHLNSGFFLGVGIVVVYSAPS